MAFSIKLQLVLLLSFLCWVSSCSFCFYFIRYERAFYFVFFSVFHFIININRYLHTDTESLRDADEHRTEEKNALNMKKLLFSIDSTKKYFLHYISFFSLFLFLTRHCSVALCVSNLSIFCNFLWVLYRCVAQRSFFCLCFMFRSCCLSVIVYFIVYINVIQSKHYLGKDVHEYFLFS